MCFRKFFFIALLLFRFIGAKSQAIDGTITDAALQPVAGAVVHLLNTNLEAVTNKQGKFILQPVTAGKYILAISSTGNASLNKELIVGASGTHVAIQLTDASVQLDAVVVTAEKKEESLRNLPVSITEISAKQAENYRLWDTKDLTAIAPDLYAANPGDDRNVTSIRGIITTSYDPAVATYIDGVNQFSLDTYIGALNDVERIEILRGPQGTLYGRNAMGGVINIITKAPTNVTNGYFELNVGNYGQQRYSGGIRFPVIKNKLFFGASVMFNKRDGYYTNLFNNSSFDNQQGLTGNYYLKYKPNPQWDILLNVKHQNNTNDGAFPLVNGVDEAFTNPFKLDQNAVAKMIDNTLNTSLSLSKSGASFNFMSQTAFQKNYRFYNAPLDGDFSAADAVTIINNYGHKWNNVKVFTQEFRFNSPAANTSSFKWTAGTYFFYQDNPSKQATHFGKDAALVGAPDTDFATISTATGSNTGIAFYGQTTCSLTKKLDMVAGLRYDYENRKLNVEGEYQKDGESAFVTQPDTAAAVHFGALSPTLGFNYKLSGSSNVFVTYSRGFRTGGLTQLSPDPSQPPLYPYKPEYSNNFEAGISNTFLNNRFRLGITVFITGVNDAQVPTLILPEAITVTKNTGKLTSKGAELELSAAPFKGFRVDYSFGYTDAKYTSLDVSENGSSVDLKGSRQIFTPELTSMLATQYGHVIDKKKKLKLVARFEWRYLGTEYFDLANTIKQSPYGVVNLRLGISSKRVGLYFWSRNTGNKKYIAYAYDFGAVHLGEPSTYGTTLLFKL